MHGLRDPLLRLGALASLTFLGACANVWVDAEGNRHVSGLMHLTLSPTQPLAAAETLRVRTFGLSWTHADTGSALLLGYGDTTLGFLRNNVCIAPNAVQPETSQ
ncbi:MAG: hypothetical protein JSR28_13985 [Proteobacteria bacterium]|nr:hypothetical protein [Pseudomonadota bacterium]